MGQCATLGVRNPTGLNPSSHYGKKKASCGDVQRMQMGVLGPAFGIRVMARTTMGTNCLVLLSTNLPVGCAGRMAERGSSARELPWPRASPPRPPLQCKQPPQDWGFMQRSAVKSAQPVQTLSLGSRGSPVHGGHAPALAVPGVHEAGTPVPHGRDSPQPHAPGRDGKQLCWQLGSNSAAFLGDKRLMGPSCKNLDDIFSLLTFDPGKHALGAAIGLRISPCADVLQKLHPQL